MNIFNMDGYIEILQDPSKQHLKVKTYRHVFQSIESSSVPAEKVEVLLDLFNKDMLLDMQYSPTILEAIKIILNKVKDGSYPEFSQLTVIACTVFDFLAMTAPLHQVQNVQNMCLDILLSYPKPCLSRVVATHPQSICTLMIQYLGNSNIDMVIKKSIMQLLLMWIKLIPGEKLGEFVNDGLNTWFSHLVPMMYIPGNGHRKIAIEVLENILPELTKINYENNSKWITICNNIKDKTMYTEFILQLYKTSDELWSRQFCCMLKLMGNELRRNGALLNCILPVLEHAFKSERSRKESFLCWRVVMDMFVMNNNINVKAIKLLTAPLIINNAKTEDIALVKLEVWWYLISILKENVIIRTDLNLYPFLQFCFGCDMKSNDVIPGLVFPNLQKFSIKAAVEMFGHDESCWGCVGGDFKKLTNPVLNSHLFESSIERWIHVVKQVTILISQNMSQSEESTKNGLSQNSRCIWMSLLKISTKLQTSNVFMEILKALQDLSTESAENTELALLMVSQVLPLVADKTRGYSSNFLNESANKDELESTPIQSLILLLLSPLLYKKEIMDSTLYTFTNFTSAGLDGSVIDFCGWILPRLSGADHSLSLWCSLAEDICNEKYTFNNDICNAVLLWPLNHDIRLQMFLPVASSWKKLFSFLSQKASTLRRNLAHLFDENILSTILKLSENSLHPSSDLIAMCVLPSIIKKRLEDHPAGQVTYLSPVFEGVLRFLDRVEKIEISNVSVISVCEVTNAIGTALSAYNSRRATPPYVQLLIKVSEATLNCLIFTINQKWDMALLKVYVLNLLDTLHNFTLPLFKNILNSLILEIIILFLKRDSTQAMKSKCTSALNHLIKIYESSSKNSNIGENLSSKIQKILESMSEDKAFRFPIQKETEQEMVTQKNSKSITDDVFVLIKPSWKFDPKKLTEHQKEVMTRRRENIPALYEDLSQSQDDYSIKPWKPVGYTSESVSDSSRSQEKDEKVELPKDSKRITDKKQDDNITKNEKIEDVMPTKVLRNIHNPVLIDSTKDLNAPSENIKEKNTRSKNTCTVLTDANIENIDIKLTDIDSPKQIDKLNKRNSFQSRLEKNLKKLQESRDAFSSPPQNQNSSSSVLPESERPLRTRRRPNKFDPDDSRFTGKRRASTSTIDERTTILSPVIDLNNVNLKNDTRLTESDNMLTESGKTETTPTKIKKKKSRLLKELEIDTVEGHPSKNIFDAPVNNNRKRNSIEPINKRKSKRTSLVKSIDKKSDKSVSETTNEPLLSDIPDNNVDPELAQIISNNPEPQNIPAEFPSPKDSPTILNPINDIPSIEQQSVIFVSDEGNVSGRSSPTFPESEDIIESSQDSCKSLIKTPRRISAVINGKVKSSCTKPLKIVSPTIILDTPCIEIKDTEITQEIISVSSELSKMDPLPLLNDGIEIVEGAEIGEGPLTELSTDQVADTDIEPVENEVCELTSHLEEEEPSAPKVGEDINLENKLNYGNELCETEAEEFADTEMDVIELSDDEESVDELTGTIVSSPHKEDLDDRNTELLNSTIDISPIKGVTFAEDTTNIEDETGPESPDPVVYENIQVSPVQITHAAPMVVNADKVLLISDSPIKTLPKVVSPDIFSSDKASPDKIPVPESNNSPPRPVSALSSPSSVMDQKKNRPMLSRVGRAAQMLGLCKIDMENFESTDRNDMSPVRTVARKNLHHLYGNGMDNNDRGNRKQEEEAVLQFSKMLPSPYASPAGPILKKTLEDHTLSPSTKKKRVSFHDPPVSTTVNVKKYIEPPSCVRSPQSKNRNYRDEFSFMKSPKVVKCLIKKMDLIDDASCKTPEMSDICSLVVETQQVMDITSHHLLDDKLPMYPSLCNCQAPISEIASELSSPMWKTTFFNEIKDDISTIGHLAKMTELEVNRLPLKTPKLATVRKVLCAYEEKILNEKSSAVTENDEIHAEMFAEPLIESIVNENNGQILDDEVFEDAHRADTIPLSGNVHNSDNAHISDLHLADTISPVYATLVIDTAPLEDTVQLANTAQLDDTVQLDVTVQLTNEAQLDNTVQLADDTSTVHLEMEESIADDTTETSNVVGNHIPTDTVQDSVVYSDCTASEVTTTAIVSKPIVKGTKRKWKHSASKAKKRRIEPPALIYMENNPEAQNYTLTESLLKETSPVNIQNLEQMSDDEAIRIQEKLLENPAVISYIGDVIADHLSDQTSIKIQNKLLESPTMKQHISDNIDKYLNPSIFENPTVLKYIEDNIDKYYTIKVERRKQIQTTESLQ